MSSLSEGSYYAIEFFDMHNDEIKEWTVRVDTKERIADEIVKAQEIHKKGHWPGEELLYSVWKVTAKRLKVNEIKREYAIQIEED